MCKRWESAPSRRTQASWFQMVSSAFETSLKFLAAFGKIVVKAGLTQCVCLSWDSNKKGNSRNKNDPHRFLWNKNHQRREVVCSLRKAVYRKEGRKLNFWRTQKNAASKSLPGRRLRYNFLTKEVSTAHVHTAIGTHFSCAFAMVCV